MPYRQRPDGNPIFNAVRLSENGVALALCSVYQVLLPAQHLIHGTAIAQSPLALT
jgi:hypothetical protein